MSRKSKRIGGDVTEISLHMECDEEELSEVQKEHYFRCDKEFTEVQHKLSEMVCLYGAEVIEKSSDQVYALQMTVPPSGVIPPLASLSSSPNTTLTSKKSNVNVAMTRKQVASNIPTTVNSPKATGQAMSTRNQSLAHTGFSLLVDPASGQIVGTRSNPATAKASAAPKQTPPPPVRVSPRVQPQRAAASTASSPAAPPPMVSLPARSVRMAETPAGPATGRGSATVKRSVSTVLTKPTENNSVGGLVAGGNKPWKPTVAPVVDLTNDSGGPRPVSGGNVPDSREIVFSKLSGKTFPSLVVTARPFMRNKDVSQTAINQSRTQLDGKVKSVLMYTPTKFTEWLIQQGYVRSEQNCVSHVTSDFVPVKLKLGMYSDVSKFPYSGGYVWISECCPARFVSVFSGSIFEGAPHPPTVLLKLMYHWSCQTSVQNVVAWVKVDNFYVKNFFTNMRSVCTSALHEKYEKMGGLRKRVEVGVISLGTTSQDGNMRQVKVEVLGVMEPESKMVRLRAVEPLQDGEKNFKRRFVKILEPLEQWVHKDSIIMTDFTVDKGTLHNMGFHSVHQVSVSESNAPATPNRYSNCNVMEYLRRIVPRMFQNTLSLLSRQIIQQFLDELVWRERWGTVSLKCFDNILQHLSEQTKLDSTDSLLTRLSRISADPFRNWTYLAHVTGPAPAAPSLGRPIQPAPTPSTVEPLRTGIDMLPQSIRSVETAQALKAQPVKQRRKRTAPAELLAPPPVPPAKRFAANQVHEGQTVLESYYYGTMEGDPNIVKKEFKITGVIKCVLCPRRFSNNILLATHLIAHAKSEKEGFAVSNIDDEHNCQFCLEVFAAKPPLKYHVEAHHNKADRRNTLACRICDEIFQDRNALIGHMHRNHVATELPYECGVCTYRSSTHRDTIEHFLDTHDGGEGLQCPLCLKVFAMSVMGRPVEQNQTAFYVHMQKHVGMPPRRCTRCLLQFVSKGAIKEHSETDHKSFCGEPGVRMFVQGAGQGVSCMMPLPAETTSRLQPPTSKGTADRGKTTFGAAKLAVVVKVTHERKCLECGQSMLSREHYTSTLKCSKCRFTTNCAQAIQLHIAAVHGKSSTKPALLDVANLGGQMHCVCGFHSDAGNQLAKHMALCERKTAYTSRQSARQSTRTTTTNSASFPPLVSLDDSDSPPQGSGSQRWGKPFSGSRDDDDASNGRGQSMLNMLGLVRKSSNEELPDADQPAKSSAAAGKEKFKCAEGKPDAVPVASKVKGPVAVDKDSAKEATSRDKPQADKPVTGGTSEDKALEKVLVAAVDSPKDKSLDDKPKADVPKNKKGDKEPEPAKEVTKDIPAEKTVDKKKISEVIPVVGSKASLGKGPVAEEESVCELPAIGKSSSAKEASSVAGAPAAVKSATRPEASKESLAVSLAAAKTAEDAGGLADVAASSSLDDAMVVSPLLPEPMVSGSPELEDLLEAKVAAVLEEEMQVDSVSREETRMDVDESMDMDTN